MVRIFLLLHRTDETQALEVEAAFHGYILAFILHSIMPLSRYVSTSHQPFFSLFLKLRNTQPSKRSGLESLPFVVYHRNAIIWRHFFIQRLKFLMEHHHRRDPTKSFQRLTDLGHSAWGEGEPPPRPGIKWNHHVT